MDTRIDDPCDSNDEWFARVRRAMTWDSMVALVVGADHSAYVRDYMAAVMRDTMVIIEPKQQHGKTSHLTVIDEAWLFSTGDKDTISLADSDRRYIGIDIARDPDFSAVHYMPCDFDEKKMRAAAVRYDRQQPPEWKGKRPR